MFGDFYFDGVSSKDIGIKIVSVGGGGYELPLFGGQSITDAKVIGLDYPTIIKTDKERLKFDITFSGLDTEITKEKLAEMGRFIMKNKNIEFTHRCETDRVLYITPVGDIKLIRTTGNRGHFSISYEASTPYWLTPLSVHSFTLAAGGTFNIENTSNIQNAQGNYDVYPYLCISGAAGDVSITNIATDEIIAFNGVTSGEVIEVRRQQIVSSVTENLFVRWNKGLFVLHGGVNTFLVSTGCEIEVRAQYPVF